jgi:amidase
MKGEITTAGSEYLAKTRGPATRDAACLAGARQRNVQIVGKTNLSEFAIGVSGANDYFGTPLNPLNPRRRLVPGGSSSGCAVAVATGIADVAFGTDTAGSIRVPAACCGVVGLKTTFGLISLRDVFPVSPRRLDTVGPIARDIPRLVQGMDLLQPGFAARYRQAATNRSSARSIRIGRLYVRGTDAKIDQAVDAALATAGFRVVTLNAAFAEEWDQALKDGGTVAAADAWLSDYEYLGKRGVSGITKATLRVGELEYNTGYAAALSRRKAWQRSLRQVFRGVGFIATPTLLKLPPKISRFGRSALLEQRVFDIQNTVAVNFAGNPALSIPIPVEDEVVPVIGLQLIGPPRSEAELLQVGRLIESKYRPPGGRPAELP